MAGKSLWWFFVSLLPLSFNLLASSIEFAYYSYGAEFMSYSVEYYTERVIFILTGNALSAILFLGILMVLWMNVAKKVGFNKFLGLLMVIPFVNMIVLGFLTFSKKNN